MNKEIRADISIVGAGVTGLLLTKKLTDLGYEVALIDQQAKVGTGPSTKNEGWLHYGTYHATSIKDEQQSVEVARRCIYGHEEIRRFAPEAIEDVDIPTYAIISDDLLAEKAIKRWEKAGVFYKPVSLGEFKAVNPEVDVQSVKYAFRVKDVSINTRILYQKLLTQSKKNGAKLFLNSTLDNTHHQQAQIYDSDNQYKLSSDQFIITAGYGIGGLFKQLTGEQLPLRFWKSHLLVFPRLTRSNVFYLDSGKAALFNHNKQSVVGQHEDAVISTEINFDPIATREKIVFDATTDLIPNARKYEKTYMAIACLKPDIAKLAGQARSLDIEVFEPIDNYIFALPGKMTEAPFVSDKIIQMIFNKDYKNAGKVALRPCDIYEIKNELK